jgi:hypothetical protein
LNSLARQLAVDGGTGHAALLPEVGRLPESTILLRLRPASGRPTSGFGKPHQSKASGLAFGHLIALTPKRRASEQRSGAREDHRRL